MRIKNIMIMSAAVAMVCSCEDLNKIEFGSSSDAGTLEVAYSRNGEAVGSFDLNSSSHTVTVEVEMNNQSLKWDIESDSDWVTVSEEEHMGSGSFTFKVAANKVFSDRQTPARLTFVAGDFHGFSLEVNQSGSVFLLDKVYEVAGVESGNTTFTVTVLSEDGEFDVEPQDEWITFSRGGQVSDGLETVTLSWEANNSASRYGTVRIVSKDRTYAELFNIFQFGDEVSFSEDSPKICVEATGGDMRVRVPSGVIERVVCSEWIGHVEEDANYTFHFSANLSDCRKARDGEITFYLKDVENPVTLPVINQDYDPLGGIATGEGLMAFAAAWNAPAEGEDFSDWKKDGKGAIRLIGNIDMTGIDGWESIGTDVNPFTGEFDGNDYHINNLHASVPIFGKCADATVTGVNIGGTSRFVMTNESAGTASYMSALAGKVSGCTFTRCSNSAEVSMTAKITKNTFVGGLFAEVSGANSFDDCVNEGSVFMTGKEDAEDVVIGLGGCVGVLRSQVAGESSLTNKGRVAYEPIPAESWQTLGWETQAGISIGGVIGLTGGSISGAENEGLVTFVEYATDEDSENNRLVSCKGLYLGGIAGSVLPTEGEEIEIAGCCNRGQIFFDVSGPGRVYEATYLGGIVGYVPLCGSNISDVTISACKNYGAVEGGLDTAAPNNGDDPPTNTKYFGGIAGYFRAKTISGCENYGGVSNRDYNKATSVSKCTMTGGIVGRIRGSSATARATLRECHSYNAVGYSYSFKRTFIGGIAGMIHFCDVTDCDSKIGVYSGAAQYYGGICAILEDSTLDGCDCESTFPNIAKNTLKAIGGVVAQTNSKVIIKNCSYKGQMSSTHAGALFGGLIGEPNGTETVQNCRFEGQINGEPMTQDNAYGKAGVDTDEGNVLISVE